MRRVSGSVFALIAALTLCITGGVVGAGNSVASPEATQVSMNPGFFATTWGGHNRSLVLRPDHTGTYATVAGYRDGEFWDAVWGDWDDTVYVVLTNQTKKLGNRDRGLNPGTVLTFQLTRKFGKPVLLSGGTPWCSQKYGWVNVC